MRGHVHKTSANVSDLLTRPPLVTVTLMQLISTESAVWSKTYIRWEIVFIICDSQKMQLRLHCEKCKHWVEHKCVTELR